MRGLDYPSERYVRLYTRDTVAWAALPWEAQALYPQILRKVDRAGVLDLGDELLADALAAIFPRWPVETLERASETLVGKKWVGYNKEDNWLFVPGFKDAESAKMTSAQRSRELRARRAAGEKEGRSVPGGDGASQNGTAGDAAGRGGTRRDSVPSLPVPTRANPALEEAEQSAAAAATRPPSDLGCRAGSDGDCDWPECPQERDGEPRATGRDCPLLFGSPVDQAAWECACDDGCLRPWDEDDCDLCGKLRPERPKVKSTLEQRFADIWREFLRVATARSLPALKRDRTPSFKKWKAIPETEKPEPVDLIEFIEAGAVSAEWTGTSSEGRSTCPQATTIFSQRRWEAGADSFTPKGASRWPGNGKPDPIQDARRAGAQPKEHDDWIPFGDEPMPGGPDA